MGVDYFWAGDPENAQTKWFSTTNGESCSAGSDCKAFRYVSVGLMVWLGAAMPAAAEHRTQERITQQGSECSLTSHAASARQLTPLMIRASLPQIKTTKDDGSCYSNFTSSLNCDSYKGSASGCSMGLFFQNKCKHTTTIAVRARLAKDEAAGFCLDTAHSKGDWCMPGLVSVAPGATTSNAVVHTDNTVYYYFAQATDDKGRTTWWYGNTSDPETNWYDIKAGNMCKQGSADTCQPFKKVCVNFTDSVPRCADSVPCCAAALDRFGLLRASRWSWCR